MFACCDGGGGRGVTWFKKEMMAGDSSALHSFLFLAVISPPRSQSHPHGSPLFGSHALVFPQVLMRYHRWAGSTWTCLGISKKANISLLPSTRHASPQILQHLWSPQSKLKSITFCLWFPGYKKSTLLTRHKK